MNLSRQDNIIPRSVIEELSILIVGAGGIGSNLANVLARMGARRITIYDDQVVEKANVAPGFFTDSHVCDQYIPYSKAIAVQIQIGENVGAYIAAVQERFTLNTTWEGDIAIMAVDSLSVRESLWNSPKLKSRHWIDCRMGGDRSTLYYVNRETGRGRELYEASFEKEVSQLPCGEKATAFITAGWIPGFVGSVIYSLVNDLTPPQHLYWSAQHGFFCCVP